MLKIALRPSGGRGEYELTGRQGDVSVDDVLGRSMVFELSPDLVVDGHSAVQRAQGKPRIRLDDSNRHNHAYSVLAGVLLLPQPKRKLRETSSGPNFLYPGGYSITDIDVDLVDLQDDYIALRPTRLWLGNAGGLARSVDATHRLAQIQALWDAAREEESKLAELVRSHEAAVVEGDHGLIKASAAALRNELGTQGDVLDQLAVHLGLEAPETAISLAPESVPVEIAEDDLDPADAARKTAAQWRRTVARSAQGRAFSQKVRTIYAYRCAVSGDAFPKLPHTASAGVDGAHILPWARYELNSPRNGICLNKLCHWAFDAAVIRIDGDSAGKYFVSVPDRVREEGLPMGMSLDYFISLEGEIPPERLPSDESEWPSPRYLEHLNSEVFG